MWQLLHDEPYILALGALTGVQAVQLVRSGLGAICPCTDEQPAGSVPEAVRRINRALQQADEVEHALGRVTRDWFVPILAGADTGLGGPLDAFETTMALVEAGAAAVQLGDLLSRDTRRRRTGGKVLASTGAFVRALVAARLAADVAGVPTVLVARTGALGAELLASDADPRDREFVVEGPRTAEGFLRVRTGIECATARALACAPYADVLWLEASKPDLAEARQFAEGVRAQYPGKRLAYGSPSCAVRGPVDEAATERLRRELGAMGYRLLLVAAPHAGLADEVLGAAKRGQDSGRAYVDLVAQVVSGGRPSALVPQEPAEPARP
jgi:isocitrate lyase